MSDESATTVVRRMVIELNQRTSDALERRIAAEGLNATTLFNRAMQVYDVIATQEAAMDDEDRSLLTAWLAGPGARPTEDDRRRWLQATRDRAFPRRPAAQPPSGDE